jgi:hypothetical protein
MSQPLMCAKTLCYLRPQAAVALAALEEAGLDTDLALAVLERLWKEGDIYAIEEDDGA